MKYSTKALIKIMSVPDNSMCFIASDVQEKERKQGIKLYDKFPERLTILNVT